VNKSLQDIRAEVVSSDIRTKSIAIEKATYLHSLGFNMNWASFHVVELMSTANVKYKRVGYLAACQSFGDDTDVVLLIPNLLKKDLASPNPAEAALAISCLANIVTPELSQTLVADVYSLLNNHKPDLRRRACLCLYKCFLRYPEALRPSFARLTECLEDDDQTVVQAAVTVLSELAMHNPKTYLPLAPKFYKLLTTSSSNWMTIKLVKVFGALTPLEPRLGKKLVGPLSEILETTGAKSLMYECIRTVVQGMTSQEKIVRQAVDKLKDMLEDTDPNIKFLALHALTFLLDSHPRIVAEHKGNIFACLDHEDANIQYCALKIVRGLVTKKTLMDTTAHLMGAMGRADKKFRDELVWSVIHICMSDRYALVTDFVWYLSVLADLIRVPSSSHGKLVGDQIVDVCLRVEVIRESAVGILAPILIDPTLLEMSSVNKTVPEALKAIAWVVGEYAHYLTDHAEIAHALTQQQVTQLPGPVQSVYIHSALKIYSSAVSAHLQATRGADASILVPENEDLADIRDIISGKRLTPFMVSLNLEVRERSCQLKTILDAVQDAEDEEAGSGMALIEEFANVFAEEVQPVSTKAQRKLTAPEDLNVNAPLSTEWDHLLESSDSESDDEYSGRKGKKGKKKSKGPKSVTDLFTVKKSKEQIAKEEKEARKMLANHKKKMGNYYLAQEEETGTGGRKSKKAGKAAAALTATDSAAMQAMQAHMAAHSLGGPVARPSIKGEDDSSDEDEDFGDAPALKIGGYQPTNAASKLHSNLVAYDPLKPGGRGEGEMPTIEAYPRFDPYERDDAFNPFSVGDGKKKKKKKKTSKKDKDSSVALPSGGEKKEKKEKKKKEKTKEKDGDGEKKKKKSSKAEADGEKKKKKKKSKD
jgi:AP-3 complex subunit delta-1